jgi:chromosome partition protein MukF
VKTLNEILIGFLASDVEIVLSKSQLGLLLLVHHRLYASDSQQQDVSESDLANFFQLIDRLDSKDPNSAQARGRAAISALQQSGVIVRSDCGGLSAIEPVYSLTSLGRAIAENITRNLQFDKDTLKSILSEAIVRLTEVSEKARTASTADDWRRSVTVPLREFVEGAFERILSYQSNLDTQHQSVREEIFDLVQAKADQAIDPCVTLLDRSMQTITELRDSLLESLTKTDELALLILVRARDAEVREAMEAAEGILKRTGQISDWTHTRMEAWSLHYQNVHSFLRYVVRVDPSRQVAERLKSAIGQFDEETPCLQICREPTIRHFNDAFLEKPPERPTRTREDFALQELEPGTGLAAQIAADIESRIGERLNAARSVRLAEILRELEQAPWHELHLATGLAMQRLLSNYKVASANDSSWANIRAEAEIQDIDIEK